MLLREPISNASFDRYEIKSIYYNLFFDNSEQDNSRLYEKFPSYDSFESFKNYIVEKFDIQIPNDPEPPLRQNRRIIVNPFSDGVNDDEPVEASTPNGNNLDRRYVVAPTRPSRIQASRRIPFEDLLGDINGDVPRSRALFQINHPRELNTSFTQYGNEDIFVNVSDILAMRDRYRAAMEEEAPTPVPVTSSSTIQIVGLNDINDESSNSTERHSEFASVRDRPPTPTRRVTRSQTRNRVVML